MCQGVGNIVFRERWPRSLHIFNDPSCLLNGISSHWWMTILVNFLENLETILFSWTHGRGERAWVIFNQGLMTRVQLWWEKLPAFPPLSENFLTIEWYPKFGGSLSYIALMPKLQLFQVHHSRRTGPGSCQQLLWGRFEEPVVEVEGVISQNWLSALFLSQASIR